MARVPISQVLMVLSLAAVVLADGGTRTCRRRYRGCIKSGKPTEECKTLMFTCFVKYCISHSRRTTNRAKEFGVKLVGCYTRWVDSCTGVKQHKPPFPFLFILFYKWNVWQPHCYWQRLIYYWNWNFYYFFLQMIRSYFLYLWTAYSIFCSSYTHIVTDGVLLSILIKVLLLC